MGEWGFTNPVLVDEGGGIIAGHGRVLAAARIYASGEKLRLLNGEVLPAGCVPVLRTKGWSREKISAYVLADNKLALNASWDEDLLRLEMGDLRDAGYDLELTGFSDKELRTVFKEASTAATLGEIKYQIIVDCKDEVDQRLVLGRLEGQGLSCRLLML